MGRSQAIRSAEADPQPLIKNTAVLLTASGITSPFGSLPKQTLLSRCPGYVTHALLTLSPLNYPQLPKNSSVRLACLSHAASVRSEPGSNSSIDILIFHQLRRASGKNQWAQTFLVTRMFEMGPLWDRTPILYREEAVTPLYGITLSWRPTVRMSMSNYFYRSAFIQPTRMRHCRPFSGSVNYKNRLFPQKT